jgi:hypothetical protein
MKILSLKKKFTFDIKKIAEQNRAILGYKERNLPFIETELIFLNF